MSVQNKHAATEDEVGILHKAITTLFNKKASAILKEIEGDSEAAIALVQGKDLAAMAKWVLDNGVTAIPSAQTEESDLAKKLAKIKKQSEGNVIEFVKEA